MNKETLKFISLVLNGVVSVMALAVAPTMAAEAGQSEIDALREQIRSLEMRLNEIQAKQEATTAIAKSAPDAVEVKLNNGRPVFSTSDGNFEMGLRGRVHYDIGTHFQDDNNLPAIAPGRDLSAGSNFRRAQLGVEGKFMRDWGYRLEFNFGGSGTESGGAIKDAILSYTGIKPLKIEIGAMQPPMTMDDTTSSNDTTFIERGAAANLATSFAGGEARSSMGVRGNGNNFYASLFYTMGVVGDGGVDEQSALVGRTAYRFALSPDSNIHVGASATRVFEFNQGAAGPVFTLQDRPELRLDATRLVSTGVINAKNAQVFGPELAGNWKNFYAQGEYYYYQIDRPGAVADADFDAWYVQASYILTGESKPYDMNNAVYGSPKPGAPLGDGGMGAIELAARYSATDLDDNASSAACPASSATILNPGTTSSCIRGGEQQIVTLGVNWYPNRNIRFMLNYLLADIDRRAYSNTAVAGGGPNVQIGQDYQALALRTQFNW
ncbi:MAG: porin [Alphaproteobacteria bacterium]